MSRFTLGRVVATPAVLKLAEEQGIDLRALLHRHADGDWGDLDAHDRAVNEAAVRDDSRILSSYGSDGAKVWIITDAASDVCPACWAGVGTCEPDKGEWLSGQHFRTDVPMVRLTTTILRPEDY